MKYLAAQTKLAILSFLPNKIWDFKFDFSNENNIVVGIINLAIWPNNNNNIKFVRDLNIIFLMNI